MHRCDAGLGRPRHVQCTQGGEEIVSLEVCHAAVPICSHRVSTRGDSLAGPCRAACGVCHILYSCRSHAPCHPVPCWLTVYTDTETLHTRGTLAGRCYGVSIGATSCVREELRLFLTHNGERIHCMPRGCHARDDGIRFAVTSRRVEV